MPEFRAPRRCTCCEVPFRPIDQLYGDESKPQKMCRPCIEHRANPEQKLRDHSRIHLERYRKVAEECEDLHDRLKRTQAAIKPVSVSADYRLSLLEKIGAILDGEDDDKDESAEQTLQKVYEVIGDWRYGSTGRRRR